MKAYLGKRANNSYEISLHNDFNSVSGFSKSLKITDIKTLPKLRKGQCIEVCLFVDSEILKVGENGYN